jgi:hypothetical protein
MAMKKVSIRLIGATVALAVAALTFGIWNPPKAKAQQGGCTLATLKGTYVFATDGFNLQQGLIARRTPFAYSGSEVYDGAGKVTGAYSGNNNGTVYRKITYTGTYTVNLDCSGTLTIVETVSGAIAHFDQFTGPDGSEFTFAQTDQGVTGSGFERRVSQ